MVSRKTTAQKSQKYFCCFPYQTQTTSVTLSPSFNNTETIEILHHTEVTEISNPNSSALISDSTVPLQFPTKTI